MQYALICMNRIMVMLLLLLLGYICYKKEIVDSHTCKKLSAFLLDIVSPIIILASYQSEFSLDKLKGLGIALIMSAAAFAAADFISRIVIKKNPNDYIEKFACIFSNCLFMGMPLIQGILGKEGVFYLTAFWSVSNLLVWTYGVLLMRGKFSREVAAGAIKSPAVAAIFIGFIFFIFQIKIPLFLLEPMEIIGDLNTPLAMITAGASIAQTNLFQVILKKRIYYISFIKLFLIPIVMILLTRFLPIPHNIFLTVNVLLACPTAANVTLFSLRYDKNYVYATEIFAMTTIISLISMPLMVLLIEAGY